MVNSNSICHRIACSIEIVPFDIFEYMDKITVAMDTCTRHPGNPHLRSLCCLGIGGDRGQPRCHLRDRRVIPGIVTSGEEGQGGIPEVTWLKNVHPGKLTWNLKITCLKKKIILKYLENRHFLGSSR